MFGFLRKNSAPALELSSIAPSTGYVTAAVTSEVTPLVTTDVTPDVTTSSSSTIASSRVLTKWAEPKPYPEPDLASVPVQIWPITSHTPVRLPSAKQIAEELAAALQSQPVCAGRWVLAQCIELVIYPTVCEQLGWPMRPWLGKAGVAAHLAKLSPLAPKYIKVEVNGEKRNLLHYYVPPVAENVVSLLRRP
jgi:hypothetical protein